MFIDIYRWQTIGVHVDVTIFGSSGCRFESYVFWVQLSAPHSIVYDILQLSREPLLPLLPLTHSIQRLS